MLYDPKWEGEWSLPKFIAFAETKSPGEWYNFTKPSECALAQYRIAHGFHPINLAVNEIPQPFLDILNPPDLPDEDWDNRYMWGEMCRRARAVAAQATVFA